MRRGVRRVYRRLDGYQQRVKVRLEEEFGFRKNVRVLGWREDMPVLMAAFDCLIQNAGGMTCIEALETGLPILVFDPILGHGELNARIMEQAGAARWLRTPEDLKALLRSLARRETSLPAPTGEPAALTTSTILGSIASDARPASVRRTKRLRLVLAGATAVSFCLWLAYSSPGMALAEKGLRLHVPGYEHSPGRVSLGVRVTDPKTAAATEDLVEKEKLPVTIFSDARGAEGLYPATGLTFGVTERSEDENLSSPWSKRRAVRNSAVGVQHATGEYPRYFLPASGASLAALADAPPHTRLVVPEEAAKTKLRPGLLVVESSGLTLEDARLRLERRLRKVRREGFECVSPGQL